MKSKITGLFFIYLCHSALLHSQHADLQSHILLKDSIVSKFNRGDFKGIYELSSPNFRKYESENGFIDFLKRVNQAGPFLSSELTDDLGEVKYFRLGMAKINIELTLGASSPGKFDVLAINRIFPYDTAYVAAIQTDNPLISDIDTAIDKALRR